jgi:hypothetical protein
MGTPEDQAWQSYESLAQAIFQAILDQDSVSNARVHRNVTLQGKTTTHQIDVYWKFEKGGLPYETVVQAKDWSKAVDQGHLLLLKSVLDDLPGQPRGVL